VSPEALDGVIKVVQDAETSPVSPGYRSLCLGTDSSVASERVAHGMAPKSVTRLELQPTL